MHVWNYTEKNLIGYTGNTVQYWFLFCCIFMKNHESTYILSFGANVSNWNGWVLIFTTNKDIQETRPLKKYFLISQKRICPSGASGCLFDWYHINQEALFGVVLSLCAVLLAVNYAAQDLFKGLWGGACFCKDWSCEELRPQPDCLKDSPTAVCSFSVEIKVWKRQKERREIIGQDNSWHLQVCITKITSQ